MGEFRWSQPSGGQESLFEPARRVVGRGEYRGLTFHEVEAKSIINPAPPGTPWFNFTINAYRGCSHACSYCLAGESPILMANGGTKPISEIRPGDRVYGTKADGDYRRFVATEVLDQWRSVKPAYRIRCKDGTTLIASGDHRFLTDRGWKHVTGTEQGRDRRPHLTTKNRLVGLGQLASPPKHDHQYKLGYLCGILRGDGTWGTYTYPRPGRSKFEIHRFRLALVDHEALERARAFLNELDVATDRFLFSEVTAVDREMWALRTSKRASVQRVREIVAWPDEPSESWAKGFLAGIFDAEGSYSRGILRISNSNQEIIDRTAASLSRFGFDCVVESLRPVMTVRLRGGRPEHLRFFSTVDPAISRKRSFLGTALKLPSRSTITEIEPLGVHIPMYDLTTTTGDFIVNGVVSHNCFARPTHEYLGFNMGSDFDSQIVVKINVVDLVRAETMPGRWAGDAIAMGTNTDPYQAAEGKYRLTKGVIEVLAERRNPFSILTKSPLVLRDLDLIATASKHAEVRVDFSIPTLDEDVWRRTEPGTAHPRKRLDAVAKLNSSGIRSGVMMAPLIPGISDRADQIEAVRSAAREAGAETCHQVRLHLRGVRGHFFEWLANDRPDLVGEYQRLYPRRPLRPSKPRGTDEDQSQLTLDL